MTTLKKTVRRVAATTTVFDRGHRRVIVTLEPGDMIGLRAERTRTTYRLTLEDAYNIAMTRTILAERREHNRRVASLVKAGHTRKQANAIARSEAR